MFIRPTIAVVLLFLVGGCGVEAPIIHPKASIRALLRSPEAKRVYPRAGFVAPYSLERVLSTFGDCRGRGRQHKGLDIAGVGPNAGLGTPIRAIAPSVVLRVVIPGEDVRRYSNFDRRSGEAMRRGRMLPRSGDIAGYGEVFYFTHRAGSSRTGVMLVTEILGGPLDGHRLRYMHMAAVNAALAPGDFIESGQEIGLMGGTAIQESSPHVHIDLETPEGKRVDIAPYLGLEADTRTCSR